MTKRKPLFIFARAAMTLLVMLLTTATAWADDVKYLDEYGVEQTCTSYTVLTGSEETISGGWYVVNSNITFNHDLYIDCYSSPVNLILADEAGITFTDDKCISFLGTLNIYAQSNGSSRGSLNTKGIFDDEYTSTLTINGGTINANNCGIYAWTFNINGGSISAYCDFYDDQPNNGIDSKHLTINGGSVNASGKTYGIDAGEDLTINGGDITASGENSGIHSSNPITLAGGTVKANKYNGTVTVKSGLVYSDGTNNNIKGTISNVSDIATKTLSLYGYSYIDENGDEQTCTNYTLLTNETDISSPLGTSDNETWYVVKGNVCYNNILHFKGDTHLILADEAHLTISSDGSGIAVNEDGIESNLTIYAQSTGNNKGKVTIEASTCIWVWNGSLTINGGDIIANGYSSGIDITYGGIIINGGTINVSGTYYGISTTTYDDTPCDIIINGGEINATTDDEVGETGIYTKGNISINGGSVIAKGSTNGIETEKDITITGGNITATTKYGTGIYSKGDIIINNGNIIASGKSYGIATSSQDIYINGGDITATGDSYGGIKAKSITLSGGIVNATATSGNHYGIGDESSTITLSGGTVTASSYNGTVKVADGFIYSDGTNNNITGTVVTSSYDINTVLTIKGLTGNQPTGADYAGTYWTTFYCGGTGFAIDTNENACAYTATVSGETITLHTLGKVIPAGTAVIIVGADNCICMTQSTATAENTVNNDLHGVDVATSLESLKTTYNANALLMLSNKNNHFGFHEVALTNVPARKAFLPINSTGARSLNIVFDDEGTTGISAVNRDERIVNSEDAWFDLQGRKIQMPTQRGLYIHNGKKIVVK